jgi:hypothetical protein
MHFPDFDAAPHPNFPRLASPFCTPPPSSSSRARLLTTLRRLHPPSSLVCASLHAPQPPRYLPFEPLKIVSMAVSCVCR